MRHLFTFLLVILLAVKIAATLARGPAPIELDAFQYWRLSSLVLAGDVLLLAEPIAYRTPVYPYFLAAVRAINGEGALWSLVLTQGALMLAATLIAASLARRITALPRAFPLTLAFALPAVSAITFSATVLSESLFVFLLMLHLLAVVRYSEEAGPGRAVFVGLTLGLAIMTRPVALMLWVPHLVLVFYLHFRHWRRGRQPVSAKSIKLHHRLGHVLIAAAVVVLLLAPWMIRNQHLFGLPRVTEFVGRNVWIVTFQEGSGAGLALPETPAGKELRRRLENVNAIDRWQHTWSVSNGLVASGLHDAQADRLMGRVAADAISAAPEAWTQKALRRIVNFWRCAATDLPAQGELANDRGQRIWRYDVPAVEWALEHRLSQHVWANTVLTALLGLAVLILLVNHPTRPYGVWLFLTFSYFAVVTGLLEIPDYRYRMVIEPLVASSFGAATAVLMSRRRKPAKVEAAR